MMNLLFFSVPIEKKNHNLVYKKMFYLFKKLKFYPLLTQETFSLGGMSSNKKIGKVFFSEKSEKL